MTILVETEKVLQRRGQVRRIGFLVQRHEPLYFIENKEKTLRASYDGDTQIIDYMD